MIQRMDHVGVVVEDLAAAIEFFVDLGLDEDIYRVCYLRGPEGIIVELAERIG